jgi:hypothetical protein
MSRGVQEPSSPAIPSQVAERTNRFFNVMLLIEVVLKSIDMIYLPPDRFSQKDAKDALLSFNGNSPVFILSF